MISERNKFTPDRPVVTVTPPSPDDPSQKTDAGNRAAEYPDVIAAMKAIAMNMADMVRVLNGTISFLTLKMHEENAKLQDTMEP